MSRLDDCDRDDYARQDRHERKRELRRLALIWGNVSPMDENKEDDELFEENESND